MAVQWREIPLPWGGGVDTKTDAKLVELPNLLKLENGVFTEAPGIKKRKGYSKLGNKTFDGSSDITPVKLATRGNELIALDGKNLYSWTESTRTWSNRGRLTGAKVTSDTSVVKASNQTFACVAEVGNIRVVAWEDSSDSIVHYSVFDINTGATLVDDTSIASATIPKLVPLSDRIHLYYYISGSTTIKCRILTPDNFASPGSDTSITATTTGIWDVVAASDGGGSVLAYQSSAGDTPINALYVNPAGAIDDGTLYTAETAIEANSGGTKNIDGLAVSAGSTHIWFFYQYDISSTEYIHVRRTTTAFASAAEKSTTIGFDATNITVQVNLDDEDDKADIWYEYDDADDTLHQVYHVACSDFTGTPAFATAVQHRHQGLAGHAFWRDGYAYVPTVHASTLQSTYFILGSDGTYIAKLLYGVAEGIKGSPVKLPHVFGYSGAFLYPAVFKGRLEIDVDESTDAADYYAEKSVKIIKLDFAATDIYDFAEVGHATYIAAGGMLWEYDGTQVVEQGFHLFPEGLSDTGSGVGGIMTDGGSYSYRVYYEWKNARGERQRSSALVYTPTDFLPGYTELTLTIPTLRHTLKDGTNAHDVNIVVYRTEADVDITAGAPFYRVSSADPSVSGANGYVVNDPDADTVTFNDELADTELIKNEIDYLTASPIDHIAPEAASLIASGKQRVFLSGVEDPYKLWYSKYRFEGDQLEFSDALTLSVPYEGGKITGLKVLNQLLVVFKRDRIYVIHGDGPNNLGQGAFGAAQLITTDVGCNNPASIVRTPAGLMFQTDKGIYELASNLMVRYLGAAVESYNSIMDIRAATLLNDVNEVRFLDAAGDTLVFNYQFNAWSTFTGHRGLSAVIVNQTYHYLDHRNDTQKEGSESDSTVSMTLRLPWLKVHGPQGYVRIRKMHLLGDYKSGHDLRYRFYYDYDSAFYDEGTFDADGVVGGSYYGADDYGDGLYGGSGAIYQFRAHLPRQKCQSMSVEISDIQSEIGSGYEITNITLEVGTKKGPAKLESSRTTSATGTST